jgi:hypothetical protein
VGLEALQRHVDDLPDRLVVRRQAAQDAVRKRPEEQVANLCLTATASPRVREDHAAA